MAHKYDIDEDLRQQNRTISSDVIETVEEVVSTANKIKRTIDNAKLFIEGLKATFSNPVVLTVLGVIAVLIIVCMLTVYITYFFLFGFSFKLEQDLGELEETAYETMSDANFNEHGYYIYVNTQGEYIFVYQRNYPDGTVEQNELLLEEALKEAYCVNIMMKNNDIDISTGDTLLLDDSDVYKTMEKIIKAEDERKEHITKSYVWLEKRYDYGYHWEDTGEVDDMGNNIKEYVKNEDPEWLPNDVWDENVLTYWFNKVDFVDLYKKDIQGEIDPSTGTARFMVPWQSVLAICEMMSSQSYDEWADTGDESKHDFSTYEYSDMDGYYLNDAEVQRIIDSMAYEFDFHYDAFSGLSHYGYEQLEDIAYRLELKEMSSSPYVGETAYIKKIPETAPNVIRNIYEYYYYHYEDVTDGYGKKICVGRSKYVNAVALVTFLKEICPQFDFDEFIEIIEHFPASESEVEKYKKLKGIYEWQLETGEPYFVEEDNFPCVTNGVRLGVNCEYTEGGENIPPSFAPTYGGNYMDGDFDYVYVAGPKYGGGWHDGWYAISAGARKDLSVSDNLTKPQIEKLLRYVWGRTGNNPNMPLYKATEQIYAWQQNGGGSITAVLGLWIHEGSLGGSIGKNAWNFSNMAATGNEPYYETSNGRRWVDFKKMYNDDIGKAMVAQFQRISNYYWNRSGIKQNTFFAMSFLTKGGIYSAQSPEEVCPTDYFTHCYCPFWDDVGFGVMPEKSPNPTYVGWANGCALYKEQLYRMAVN